MRQFSNEIAGRSEGEVRFVVTNVIAGRPRLPTPSSQLAPQVRLEDAHLRKLFVGEYDGAYGRRTAELVAGYLLKIGKLNTILETGWQDSEMPSEKCSGKMPGSRVG